MDFISKMAASKMGQLKAEIAELKERLEETHTDEQRARLKKTIREKETYYNILADRIRMHSIFDFSGNWGHGPGSRFMRQGPYFFALYSRQAPYSMV
ncbi:hypothetical protein M5E89_11585 [Acidaminococcus intestini]|nr:hypothetical protein M5E89_11585 [Acidaminococcus intestini]